MTVQAPERIQQPVVHDEPPPPARAASVRPVVAGALAAAAAAWMAGGLFRGTGARITGLAGVALGAGLVALSLRTRRPSLVQYLALPLALVAGALLVLPETGAGSANIVSLVAEALRTGGLAQPPVAFDPGWRFLVLVLMVVLSASAAALALSLDRPKLAVAVPVPVLLGAALLQPAGGEVVSGAVAIAFVLAALAVAYGGELASEGGGGKGFETRRLARAAVAVVVLVIGLAALNRADALFPEPASERVVPAQRPPAGGTLGEDRVLFTVEATTPGPWRIGVLDVYDGLGWLLPPFDPARLVDVDGGVPGTTEPARALEATFRIGDVPGHVIPAPAEPAAVAIGEPLQIDPRTGVLRLPEGRARTGLTYTVTAPAAPTGRELADAPPADLAEFIEVPPPPNEVLTLLEDAPENPWNRLVHVRAALYANVVAAGQGRPEDVPSARVAEMLGGADASPFEITAAEALLARWAGVPSRIGFGFYAGDERDGLLEVRPKHGATWLEVAFEGHGWVPVVGLPPRARAALSPEQQQESPMVLPTDELALIVWVPIQLRSGMLAFEVVRWWLARIAPVAAGIALAWWLVPGLLKVARGVRRRRWAGRGGSPARVTVAYAELRDAATDLGIGEPALTPLELLEVVERDDEHAELAWLVTRALWGDLRRDLGDDDADRAAELARSIARRLRRARPAFARVVAFGTRASLRDPYTTDVPNLWPAPRRAPRRVLRARLAPAATGLGLLLLAACVRPAIDPSVPAGALPARGMPETIGELRIEREHDAEAAYAQAGDASLVEEGQVYALRRDEVVEAYVQVASFIGGINALDEKVARGVLRSIGFGTFRLERLGDERAYVQRLPEQRMFLSFSPDGGAFTLMVARRAFPEAASAFVDILRHQRGDPLGARAPDAPAYDPRRGTQ